MSICLKLFVLVFVMWTVTEKEIGKVKTKEAEGSAVFIAEKAKETTVHRKQGGTGMLGARTGQRKTRVSIES